MKFKPDTNVKITGTSLMGYFAAPYYKLEELLGPPNCSGDGEKVSTEWMLSDENGKTYTIYDYKETNLYDDDLQSVEEFRLLETYEWHLGGGGNVNALKAWLKESLDKIDGSQKEPMTIETLNKASDELVLMFFKWNNLGLDINSIVKLAIDKFSK